MVDHVCTSWRDTLTYWGRNNPHGIISLNFCSGDIWKNDKHCCFLARVCHPNFCNGLLRFHNLLCRQWGSSIVNYSILEILGMWLDFNWYIVWNTSLFNLQKSEKIRFSLWEGISQDSLHATDFIQRKFSQ